jgi:hypothetical protein
LWGAQTSWLYQMASRADEQVHDAMVVRPEFVIYPTLVVVPANNCEQ